MDMQTNSETSGTMYLAGLVAALIGAAVYYHVRAFSFWSSRGIRGPTPWPLFGTNIYYLLGNKLDVDEKWRQQYGKTYGLYEGYSPLLRTTDNQVIKAVFIKQFNSFTDRHGRFIYGNITRNWLLFAKGDSWSNKRALISPMFSSAKMRPMFAMMSKCIDNFLDMVEKRLGSGTQRNLQNGAAITQSKPSATFVKQDVSAMTLDVIATSFFSLKLNTYGAKEDEFLRRAYAFVNIDLPWLIMWMMIPAMVARYFKIDLFRPNKMDYFNRLSNRIIQERKYKKTNGGDGNTKKNDIIQAFLDARIPDTYEQVFSQEDDKEAHYNDQIDYKQLEGEQREQTKQARLFRQFEDIEIQGQMSFLLLAGFETTATTVNFCLYELSHHPKIQQKLFEEMRAKFAPTSEAEDLSSIDFSKESYSDLLDMKHLDAFVSEVLRMYSPLVDHTRTVTASEGVDLMIDGRAVHLPNDTPISVNGYVLQRDQDYWAKPHELNPDRFLPENRDKIQTCTFMPFGVGPRHCAGMRFALLEVKLALAKILARYVVTPGPKNGAYPPKYASNLVFLQLEHSDFNLTPRRGAARIQAQ